MPMSHAGLRDLTSRRLLVMLKMRAIQEADEIECVTVVCNREWADLCHRVTSVHIQPLTDVALYFPHLHMSETALCPELVRLPLLAYPKIFVLWGSSDLQSSRRALVEHVAGGNSANLERVPGQRIALARR